jgi:hypothetical protein
MLNGKRGLVNEFRGRKRYNFVFGKMKNEISIRIKVLRPLKGIKMKVQRGKDELLFPAKDTVDEQIFELDIDVDLASAVPNFLGKYAQGPKNHRFIYVNSGIYAAQSGTVWNRRAKITLMNVTRAQIDEVLADPALVLETEFDGVGRDGGPTCASVKGLVWKVTKK